MVGEEVHGVKRNESNVLQLLCGLQYWLLPELTPVLTH